MLHWSIALLMLSAVVAEEECSLLQYRTDLVRKDVSKPWDHHLYLVGTRHKAGSQVLRNIMHLAFDELGANLSCQEYLDQAYIPSAQMTTKGGDNKCLLRPQIPIHWDNRLSTTVMQRDRHIGAEMSKPLRGVQIIRDPLQMVTSAYSYHHRGQEPGSPMAPSNITKMGAAEGVPGCARTMLGTVKSMVDAYLATGTDIHVVRFENFTRSSLDFDSQVAETFDHLFKGLITDSEMSRIKDLAKQEDLHRGQDGISAGTGHVSDDEEKKLANAALDLIEPDLLQQYHEFQTVLGYPVGH